MSESLKQTKSTSSPKDSPEENQKSGTTPSKKTCIQNNYPKKRSDGRNGWKTSEETNNYSRDANITSYNFSNNFSAVNYQPLVNMNGHMNGHSSHYQPIYYPMNGNMYYRQTFRAAYCQPNYMTSFGYSNYSEPKRMYSQSSGPNSGEQMSDRVMKFRQMIKTSSADNKEPNEFRFSIMTYNILSQNLLEEHQSLYQHCEPLALSWPKRGQRILKELLDSNCDIICLQEVNSQHLDQLLGPALKQNGYNWVFKQRTGGKMDGCLIAFKENKFCISNQIKLDFVRRDLSSLLDRDNIALIVELKPKEMERKLIVANTHLLYNPKRGDIKLAQIRLLLAEIEKIAKISEKEGLFDYNPIILCGDLNSEPNSLLYNFITKGSANLNGRKVGDISGQRGGIGKGKSVEDYHLKLLGVTSDTRFEKPSDSEEEVVEKMAVKHNLKLKSVVLRFENKFGQKLISTSNRFDSGLVDYIFYDYNKLRLRAFQRLLTENQLPQIGYIPNTLLGSDHLSFKAIFSII